MVPVPIVCGISLTTTEVLLIATVPDSFWYRLAKSLHSANDTPLPSIDMKGIAPCYVQHRIQQQVNMIPEQGSFQNINKPA
jgi:hypothetical protein